LRVVGANICAMSDRPVPRRDDQPDVVELPAAQASYPFPARRFHGTERVYRFSDGEEVLAFTLGNPATAQGQPWLVRIHSQCTNGDVFGSLLCDCGPQLDEALDAIATAGAGALLYFPRHEGRGLGHLFKGRNHEAELGGVDTVDASHAQGRPVDVRSWTRGAIILRHELGLRRIRLLTNNPEKAAGLRAFGIDVEQQRTRTYRNPHNSAYLDTKRNRLGHALDVSGSAIRFRNDVARRVGVVGGAVIDVISHVRRLPEPGTAVQLQSQHTTAGGKGLSIAVALTRLDVAAHFYGVAGTIGGESLERLFEKNGVQFPPDMLIADAQTPIIQAFVDEHGVATHFGHRNIEQLRLGPDRLARLKNNMRELSGIVLTLEPHLDDVASVIEMAKQDDVRVILHPSPVPEGSELLAARSLLTDVDILVATPNEARALIDDDSTNIADGDLAVQLTQRGVALAVVTPPVGRAAIATQHEQVSINLQRRALVDTSGATCAFTAGLLSGLLDELDLKAALARADAANALTIARPGSPDAMPSRRDVISLATRQSPRTHTLDPG
jgi:GTP cyclohydrolase II